MKAMGKAKLVVDLVTAILQKTPWERIAFRPPNHTKHLERLAAVSTASSQSVPEGENRPSSAEHAQTTGPSAVMVREGLDLGTLGYQEQKAYNELWLAESHAKEDFLGCGTDVDCGFKHGLNFVAVAQETKSMTTDPIWQQIDDLGQELQIKAHPERVKEGTHHDEYQALAIKISQPRREMQKRIMARRKPSLSLEEAKRVAAEEAAKAIEESWGKED